MKQHKLHVIKRLFIYLRPHRFSFIIAIVLSICSNLFVLVGPKLSGMAINEIEIGAGKINVQKIIFYAVIMVLLYVISAIMSYITNWCYVKYRKEDILPIAKGCI